MPTNEVIETTPHTPRHSQADDATPTHSYPLFERGATHQQLLSGAPHHRRYTHVDPGHTARRWRLPVQRQRWHNSRSTSDWSSVTRRVPIYLLVMDLTFNALFAIFGSVLRIGLSGVPQFFRLYLPLQWHWMVINSRMCLFDADDVSSDVFVTLVLFATLGLALHSPVCFYELNGAFDPAPNWVCNGTAIPAASTVAAELGGKTCTPFFAFYLLMRLISTVHVLYVSAAVSTSRFLLVREMLGWVFSVPLMVHVASGDTEDSLPAVQSVFFIAGVGDMFFNLVLQPLLVAIHRLVRRACGGKLKPRVELVLRYVINRVPYDSDYLEQRWQRMLVLSLGSVVANAVYDGSNVNSALAAPMPLAAGISLMSLLVKIYCFDLSPQFVAVQGHALRSKGFRGKLWTMLYGVLLGNVRWLSISADVLIKPMPASGPELIAAGFGEDRLSFIAALTTFMLVVTGMHLTHTSAGSEIPVHQWWRYALRLLYISLAWALAIGMSGGRGSYFWTVMTLLTMLAALELWVVGFTFEPGFCTACDTHAERSAQKLGRALAEATSKRKLSSPAAKGIELKDLSPKSAAADEFRNGGADAGGSARFDGDHAWNDATAQAAAKAGETESCEHARPSDPDASALPGREPCDPPCDGVSTEARIVRLAGVDVVET